MTRKRIALTLAGFLAVLVIALVIAYVAIDQMLLGELAAQREAIRAAGGAESLADLVPGKLDDTQNAAVIYREAAALLTQAEEKTPDWRELYVRLLEQHGQPDKKSIQKTWRQTNEGAPLTPDESARLDEYLNAIQPGLDVLKKALPLRECKYRDYDLPEALTGDHRESFTFVQVMTRATALKAVWEGTQGTPSEAFNWITLGLHIVNHADADPLLISGMIRVSSAATVLNAAETLLYQGDIPASFHPEFFEELAALGDRRRCGRILEGERCYSTALWAQFEQRTLGRPVQTWARINLNEQLCCMRDIVNEPDYARRQELHAVVLNNAKSVSLLDRLGCNIFPNLFRSNLTFEEHMARVGLFELAIALKQHKREHGVYPAGLDALVPTCLRSLPEDPFSGKPFGYRPVDEGFEVFSVGFPDGHGKGIWRSIR